MKLDRTWAQIWLHQLGEVVEGRPSSGAELVAERLGGTDAAHVRKHARAGVFPAYWAEILYAVAEEFDVPIGRDAFNWRAAREPSDEPSDGRVAA